MTTDSTPAPAPAAPAKAAPAAPAASKPARKANQHDGFVGKVVPPLVAKQFAAAATKNAHPPRAPKSPAPAAAAKPAAPAPAAAAKAATPKQ